MMQLQYQTGMSGPPNPKNTGFYITLLTTLSVVFVGLSDVRSWNMSTVLSGSPQHFLAFGVLGFVAGIAFPGRALIAFIAMSALGALIEIIQPSFGRAFEWSDIAMNTLGAGFGTAAAASLQRFRHYRQKRRF